MTKGELWEMIGRGELRRGGGGGGGWGRCKQLIKHMFFDLMQLVRGFLYRKIILKNGQLLNKPQMRLLLKISRGTFIKSRQIYIYIYSFFE